VTVAAVVTVSTSRAQADDASEGDGDDLARRARPMRQPRPEQVTSAALV